MEKTLKIIGMVVFGLIIVFTIIGSIIAIRTQPISGQNTTDISSITGILSSLNSQVSNNANQITDLNSQVSNNANQITDLNSQVSNNANQITDLKNQVDGNTNQISDLTASHQELQKVVWAHGVKTNRVVQAIFETAFGVSSETSQRIQSYTQNPYSSASKETWERAVLRLSERDAEKAVELVKLEEKILQNQQKLSNLKPQAFKR